MSITARLLGPFEIEVAGRPVLISRRQERALLALLLLEHDRPVPAERLADLLWDGQSPARYRALIQSQMSRLRAALRAVGGEEWIQSARSGYALRAPGLTLDVDVFRQTVRQARAEPDACGRARLLRVSLELWRGPALVDVASDRLRSRVLAQLEELRAQAAEEWPAAMVLAGRCAEALEALVGLVAEYPQRESLVELTMRVLHGAGRTSEALEVFERFRGTLAEETGLDPSPKLLRAQMMLLRQGEHRVDRPECGPASTDPGASAGAVPAQVPGDVRGFVGRQEELAELDRLLLGDPDPSAVVISAIAGTAGVGKTALALRWAHRARARFPDGQLYVDLRGYDPDRPLPVEEVLVGFLRELGVAAGDIPRDLAGRSARFRSLVAGRRMLVLLDNAGCVEQVRPLLPGDASCRVLVTSRDSLAGLVARDGACRLNLDLLPAAQAVALLQTMIGDRVVCDLPAADRLASRCARLPLALRIAAEYATSRPGVGLADLAADLADERQRLDVLDAGGDTRTALRAVFSWSYSHLPAPAARVFRLLGCYPGHDWDEYVVAALAGIDLASARGLVLVLTRAHLVQPAPMAAGARHGMHDLLRAYAAELAGSEGDETERSEAITRLLDYYLATTASAVNAAYPAERHHRPEVSPGDQLCPAVNELSSAVAWLSAERANLISTLLAAGDGWPGHTVRLAAVLWRYLDTGARYADILLVCGFARRIACASGDRDGEATLLNGLASAHFQRGEYEQAITCLQQSVAAAIETGNRICQARALTNLATALLHGGEHERAAEYAAQALPLHRTAGNTYGVARTLNALGEIHRIAGRYAAALDLYQQVAKVHRCTGDRLNEGIVLGNIGIVQHRLGNADLAERHLRHSLAIVREAGFPQGEGFALDGLGLVFQRLGRYDEAIDHHREALAIHQRAGNRRLETETSNNLGETLRAAGRRPEAMACHEHALAVAAELGDRFQQARAHDGIAHLYQLAGADDLSKQHWRQALVRYTDLDLPEAETVRGNLAAPRH
ncbi:MAG: tetratricopeptide repeat protein [Dactylosporangium sp.]|nr:tetratricopeptide repeat protein [Dactylosporangium sp.]NNJ62313.1 tetratricopeptide repeat protein [Dactylosporangium sp.]